MHDDCYYLPDDDDEALECLEGWMKDADCADPDWWWTEEQRYE